MFFPRTKTEPERETSSRTTSFCIVSEVNTTKKILQASLAAMVVLGSAGCGASGSAQGFPSSRVANRSSHTELAAYSSANPSPSAWNPQIEKLWMVGQSEATFNRPPKHASQAITLVHRLLKGAVRASDAPPVTMPWKTGHQVTADPFGPPTLYLKTPSGTYLLYPDYSIVPEISRSVRVTSTAYSNGHVVSRTTKTPTLYHLVLHAPYIVIQKHGQAGRQLAIKDAALFQWLAKDRWVPEFD